MKIETERRFLVTDLSWQKYYGVKNNIEQGYIARVEGGASVRVRIEHDHATLNIKQAVPGASRPEYEYKIPIEDAELLLDTMAFAKISKTRYFLYYEGSSWEIDIFDSPHDGLIIAEIELEHIDQEFKMPPWIGEEVTHKEEYSNYRLAEKYGSNQTT